MACIKCGYCEHCGRSNQLSFQQSGYPYQNFQPYYQHWNPLVVTYGTTGYVTIQNSLPGQQSTCEGQITGGQTFGPGLSGLSQMSQQQQAACGHSHQEKTNAPISR